MNIRSFDFDKDYLTICSWYRSYDKQPPYKTALSKTGYIVEDICVGFLYKTDSNIAFIEGYISNPKSDKNIKHKALDLITENLIMDAKDNGFKTIISMSNNKHVINMMKNFNYEITDYTCGIRRL